MTLDPHVILPSCAEDRAIEDWEELCEAKADELWASIAKDGGRQFVKDYDADGELADAFNVINTAVENIVKETGL